VNSTISTVGGEGKGFSRTPTSEGKKRGERAEKRQEKRKALTPKEGEKRKEIILSSNLRGEKGGEEEGVVFTRIERTAIFSAIIVIPGKKGRNPLGRKEGEYELTLL